MNFLKFGMQCFLLFVLLFGFANSGLSTLKTTDPEPEIEANGSDGPITISQSDVLSVDIELNSGALHGQDADWWVVAENMTASGITQYHFDAGCGCWKSGWSVSHQGPLVSIASAQVLSATGLPAGSYTFYFGVDMVMNGTLDTSAGVLFYDSVSVTIDSAPYFQANLLETGWNNFYSDLYANIINSVNSFLRKVIG